jgi:hypothetical protein
MDQQVNGRPGSSQSTSRTPSGSKKRGTAQRPESQGTQGVKEESPEPELDEVSGSFIVQYFAFLILETLGGTWRRP